MACLLLKEQLPAPLSVFLPLTLPLLPLLPPRSGHDDTTCWAA